MNYDTSRITIDLTNTTGSMLSTISTEIKPYIFIEVWVCQTEATDICSRLGSIQ
jgi:hypothetical protein